MKAPATIIALCATRANAFFGVPVVPQQSGSALHTCASTRPQQPLSMAGSAFATSRAGKAKVVEEVSELLSKSSLIFAVPSSSISANEVVNLRKNMPDGCTARVVKNKLMRIAAEGTDFESVSDITTGENFWMFVQGEDNLAAPIKYIKDFAGKMSKDKVAWQTPFKAGIFDKSVIDGPGVIAISKLPTKQELIQRLAVALNAVPTRLGRGINLVPTKVGRVVKLAFAEDSENEEETAAPEAEAAAPEAEAAAPAAEGGEEAADATEDAAAPDEAPAAE